MKYLCMYLIIFMSCFFPAYCFYVNEENLIFTTVQIPLSIYILSQYKLLLKANKKHIILLVLILIYFFFFLYANVVYNMECYWALFFKTSTFVFLWMLLQNNLEKNKDIQYINIFLNVIIFCFTVTVIVSLIGYLLGVDAIHLNLADLDIRANGVYSDKRLTWLFMHKSTYGLLIVAMLYIILQKENLPCRKIIIIMYLITIVAINSMVSLISAIIIFFVKYMETQKYNRAFVLKIFIIFVGGLFVGIVGYCYLATNRDISSLGSRTFIWNSIPQIFEQYPHGMGKQYYSIKFWIERTGIGSYYVNNLHNVFINEMLHYSIPVGIIYILLLLYIPIVSIKKSKNKLQTILLTMGLMLPMFFDQSVKDIILPFYLLLQFLCFTQVPSITFDGGIENGFK